MGPGPSGAFLAGWWRRVGATLVDGLLISVPLVIAISLRVSRFAFSGIDSLVLMVYEILLLSRIRGQTVGNMAASTRVVDVNTGGPISTGKAAVRAVVELVLKATAIGGLLDILWPLWDSYNQTLHDKAAGTLVVMV